MFSAWWNENCEDIFPLVLYCYVARFNSIYLSRTKNSFMAFKERWTPLTATPAIDILTPGVYQWIMLDKKMNR